MAYSLGIDLGGTKLALGLVNKKGAIILKQRVSNLHGGSAEDFLKILKSAIKPYVKIKLKMVGVGFAGETNASGKIIFAPNLPKPLLGFNLKKYLETNIKTKAIINNDARAFLKGEVQNRNLGKRGLVLGITIGTGIGGAINFNGDFISGQGNEIGHTIVNIKGFKCRCGKIGCLEAQTGSQGLVNFYREFSGKNINTYEIIKRYRRGEPAASKAFKLSSLYFSLGVSNLINLLNPNAIIIGGGMGKIFFTASSLKIIKSMLYYKDLNTKLYISKHTEDSTIIGSVLI